ncbi:response regulator [Rhizobacter sp. J219]|jgi:CheY-like chemotaxis protein|uniref:response regulator n=1 Tax=Rhizobacter sp. J219 TaxID=2898430 RepID=UPI0021512336|nr:response regulator [Rhizobacter sp. J219]MCR5882410.1 response regulator [Rhizobacter sp. J219]
MARILVIEDNQANLDLAQYLLEHRGHQVLVATDGQMGLAMARRERPELIVCDLQMPVLDGYGVLEQLRRDAAMAGIPVVAVTAFSMSGDEEKVRMAGFDGYFSKPIEPETFVAQIEAFLPSA